MMALASTTSQHAKIMNKPYYTSMNDDSGKLPLFDIIVTPPNNDDENGQDDNNHTANNRTRKPALISSPAIDIETEDDNLSTYDNAYLVVPSDINEGESYDISNDNEGHYRSRSYSFSAGGADEMYDSNWNCIRDRVREKLNPSSKSTQELNKSIITLPLRRCRSKSVIGSINNTTIALPFNVRKRLSFSEIAGERGDKLRLAKIGQRDRYLKGMEQSRYDLVVPVIDPVKKGKFKFRSNSAIVMTAYDKKVINMAQERARGMKKSATSHNNNTSCKNDVNASETAPTNSTSTPRTLEIEVVTPRSKINTYNSDQNNANQVNDMEVKSSAVAKTDFINGQSSSINDDSTVDRPHTPTSAFFNYRLRGRTYTSPHDLVAQDITDANMEISMNKENNRSSSQSENNRSSGQSENNRSSNQNENNRIPNQNENNRSSNQNENNRSSNQNDVIKVKAFLNRNDSSNGLINGYHEKSNQDSFSPRSLSGEHISPNRKLSIDENSAFETNGDTQNPQNGMVLSSSNESCVSESFHHQVRQQLQEITTNLTSSVLVQYVPNPHDM